MPEHRDGEGDRGPYQVGYREGYDAKDWGESMPRDRYGDPDDQREYEMGYQRAVDDRLLW